MKYPLILKLSVGAVALDCVGKVSGIVNRGIKGNRILSLLIHAKNVYPKNGMLVMMKGAQSNEMERRGKVNIKKEVAYKISEMIKLELRKLTDKIDRNRRNINNLAHDNTVLKRQRVALIALKREWEGKP